MSALGKSLNNSIIDWEHLKVTTPEDEIYASISYLTDKDVWKKYCNNSAAWAIGTPTVELFLASYNKRKETNISVECSSNGYINYSRLTGGTELDNNIYCINTAETGAYVVSLSYIFASPSTYTLAFSALTSTYSSERGIILRDYEFSSWNATNSHSYPNFYIRPIVCIPRAKFDSQNMIVK